MACWKPVTQMARQITESDGVLFVSPEYNYSIPAGSRTRSTGYPESTCNHLRARRLA